METYPAEKTEFALVGADSGLENTLRSFLGTRLKLVSSVVDLPGVQAEVIIVPEVLSECEGEEVLKTLNGKARMWFVSSDNSRRDAAAELGAERYFTLPLGKEFESCVSRVASDVVFDSGKLSLFSFLLLLSSSRLSGTLRMSGGEILLRDGQIAEASFEGVKGEEALTAILSLPGRRWEFSEGEVQGGSINQPTEHLLLAIASRLDEGG